jgi:ketosteroid isomerase-like protein
MHSNTTETRSADEATLVALNETFQHAVLAGDVPTLDRILADDFLLYTSGGADTPLTKSDVIEEARRSRLEQNDSSDVRARVWGDTGVVTARLTMKGSANGQPFEAVVRFTDTYVCTAAGWKQVSAHASRIRPVKEQ